MLKQREFVEITSAEYFTAQDRWYSFWKRHNKHNRLFANFLGFHHGFDKASQLKLATLDRQQPQISVPLGHKAARKIKMLNDPQHFALLTSYRTTRKFPKEAMNRTRCI